MYIQVYCALEFYNDFCKNNLFNFSRIISPELIFASLFIIEAILNPFQLPSMYSVQGIFQPHFPCKTVHTILDKIWYVFFNFKALKTLS